MLKGGYVDEQWAWVGECQVTWESMGFPGAKDSLHIAAHRAFMTREQVKPFTVVRRTAEHLHRVQGIKPGRPAWTLIFTGPRRRSWGFVEETGWKHWREYLGIPKP